ncbi:MAG: hypothetical protein KAU31_16350 [Spirochaetaceae bacterium]|nr:hypothetical protein [Spirochaetaceae bacterium]
MKWTAEAIRWKKIFEEYEGEGVKRKEFCAERRIKSSTFDYWRARLRKTLGEGAGVVRVGRVAAPAAAIRVRVNERVVIELDGGVAEEQLVRVLRAAGQA